MCPVRSVTYVSGRSQALTCDFWFFVYTTVDESKMVIPATTIILIDNPVLKVKTAPHTLSRVCLARDRPLAFSRNLTLSPTERKFPRPKRAEKRLPMENTIAVLKRHPGAMVRFWLFGLLAVALGAISTQAQPFAYVANSLSNNVSVIDTATNTVEANVPVC